MGGRFRHVSLSLALKIEPMQDIIAFGIATVGYFCSAISLAVYADEWINHTHTFTEILQSAEERVGGAAGATSV